jgi:tetratricopeptide (TPR) repeat protein
MARANTPQDPLASLLGRGLEHYGRNEVEDAIRCWREVLEIAPGHAVATDYLASAGVPVDFSRQAEIIDFRTARAQATAQPQTTLSRTDIERLLREGNYEEALRILYTARARSPQDTGIARSIQVLRERLSAAYSRELVDLDLVPVLSGHASGAALTDEEQQVLSLVDGISSYGDIVAASPLGRLPTLRALCGFVRQSLCKADTSEDTEADANSDLTSEPQSETNLRAAPVYAADPEPESRILPDDYESVFRRATQAYMMRDFPTALELFAECARRRPEDPRPEYNLKALKRRIEKQ